MPQIASPSLDKQAKLMENMLSVVLKTLGFSVPPVGDPANSRASPSAACVHSRAECATGHFLFDHTACWKVPPDDSHGLSGRRKRNVSWESPFSRSYFARSGRGKFGFSKVERLEGSELNSFSPVVSCDLPSSAGWPVFVRDPQARIVLESDLTGVPMHRFARYAYESTSLAVSVAGCDCFHIWICVNNPLHGVTL